MKRALIFGANGYLGRNFTHYLSNNGVQLRLTDIQEKSVFDQKIYIKSDIVFPAQLEKLDFDVDVIFVFCGLNGPLESNKQKQKFTLVNETGLQNILDHYVKTGSQARLIFPSSRLVYKGKKNQALKEDDIKEAKTTYAQNKIFGEKLLIDYQKKHGIKFTIFRICVPYGNICGSDYSYGTIGNFLKSGLQKKNINLFGDGSQKRTFTHILDVAGIINEALKTEKTLSEIYNIGGETLSLEDTAKMTASVFQIEINYVPWPEEAEKIESGDTIFDSSKLDKLINYKYSKNFRDWISDLDFDINR